MSSIVINDLNPNDSYLSELNEDGEMSSVKGGFTLIELLQVLMIIAQNFLPPTNTPNTPTIPTVGGTVPSSPSPSFRKG